jgi:hypothetical protein
VKIALGLGTVVGIDERRPQAPSALGQRGTSENRDSSRIISRLGWLGNVLDAIKGG